MDEEVPSFTSPRRRVELIIPNTMNYWKAAAQQWQSEDPGDISKTRSLSEAQSTWDLVLDSSYRSVFAEHLNLPYYYVWIFDFMCALRCRSKKRRKIEEKKKKKTLLNTGYSL